MQIQFKVLFKSNLKLFVRWKSHTSTVFLLQGQRPESERNFLSKSDEKHIYSWVTNMVLPPYILKMQFHKYMLLCIRNNIL